MDVLTSSDFSDLFNQRFFNNVFPVPPTSTLNVGDQAPTFELPNVCSDRPFDLKKYLAANQVGDRRLLLAFTRIFTEKQYCPLCFPHIKALNDVHQSLNEQGIDVVMITSTDENQSSIVAQDLMLNMPLLSDPDCAVFRKYQLGKALGAPLPAQFLLSPQGYIQFRHLFSFIEPNAHIDRLLAL